jgi:hypothetical protein
VASVFTQQRDQIVLDVVRNVDAEMVPRRAELVAKELPEVVADNELGVLSHLQTASRRVQREGHFGLHI